MKITRSDDVPSQPTDASHFDGGVTSRDLGTYEAPSGGALIVSFSAGARTHWHSHPDGQFLFVTDGEGRVGSRGGEVSRIRPGDLVYAAPNEQHWHGGAEESALSHLALSLGTTEWFEPVED
ncbi:MAG: cupin domain-containing protein [Candidatus Limnocylindria bacterium]